MMGEVIIGEFALPLFAPPFGLIPLCFQNIFIHVRPPFLLFVKKGTSRENSPPDAKLREGSQDPEGTQ